MDPVTLIVSALTAGASAGFTDVAKDTVLDLYARLKSALLKRIGAADPGAGKTLERHANDPTGYEVPVRDLVVDAGADEDQSILDLAQQLLAKVDPEGAQVGKYNVNVTGGNVGAIGDNARVSQAFGTSPSA